MRTNYVLIDYENVQPSDMNTLDKEYYKIILFHGASQANVKIDIVTFMHRIGTRGEYVKISGNGKNALDFHIPFYIGRLSIQEPSAFFHIISKDSGFDPLVEHLKSKKILACRSTDISKMPKPIDKAAIESSILNPKSIPKAITVVKSSDEKALALKVVPLKPTPVKKPVEKIVALEKEIEKQKVPGSKKARLDMAVSILKGKGMAMPKTAKALLNTMSDIFKKQLSEKEIQVLFDEMQKQKIIIADDNMKITYNLSKQVVSTTKPTASKVAILNMVPVEKIVTVETKSEKQKVPESNPEKLKMIISVLKKRGAAAPKTTKGLLNTLEVIFSRQMTQMELLPIFTELKKQEIIIVDEKMKVTYNLPANWSEA